MWEELHEDGSYLKQLQARDYLYCHFEPTRELKEVRLAHLFMIIDNSGTALSMVCLGDGGCTIKAYSDFNSCFWWCLRVDTVSTLSRVNLLKT